jgi:hypothetical protein
MAEQERKTPESDPEFLLAFMLCDSNRSELARMYGVDEASIRRRLYRIAENDNLRKRTDELRKHLIEQGMSVEEAFTYQVKRVTGYKR